MGIESVKNIVLVLSGKGGVGKSSVTVQTALTLSSLGHTVGILDTDLTGPSIPRLLHVESEIVQQSPTGWVPVPACNGAIATMSIGFLLRSRNDSVVWRGPKKTAMVRQLISDVDWGCLDYLLIDTPPGTSDEHIALAEVLREHADRLRGAVVVTTPQAVSTADVRKELNFCVKVGFEVLGVVENMSGYVCPHCSECTNIFSSGGGKLMAEEFKVEFLGAIPIDPNLVLVFEEQEGEGLLEKYKKSKLFPLFQQLVGRVVEKCVTNAASAG